MTSCGKFREGVSGGKPLIGRLCIGDLLRENSDSGYLHSRVLGWGGHGEMLILSPRDAWTRLFVQSGAEPGRPAP